MTRCVIHGVPVRIDNTRPDIRTEDVVARLTAALDLIAAYAPRRYRRLRQDIAGFVVERFACRGAFFPDRRECLVELTFTVNPRHSLGEIAASIVHEATHARVAHRCGALPLAQRPREERLCRQAELEFGLALPDGAGGGRARADVAGAVRSGGRAGRRLGGSGAAGGGRRSPGVTTLG